MTEESVGEIAGAGLLSHVPTIVLPKKIRLALNGGRELSLMTGFERLRREVLDGLRPDTFIVFDTHWFTAVEFAISAPFLDPRRAGRVATSLDPAASRSCPRIGGSPNLAARSPSVSRLQLVRAGSVGDGVRRVHVDGLAGEIGDVFR